jgi:ABC-type antimicrobial peptide transport system permease subunit
MALGASAAGITRWVMRQGLVLVVIGITVGLVGALAMGRLIQGLLFDVAPNDPLTLSLVPLLLGAITLVAGWLPARRAMKIDPAIVLREE